MSTVIGRRHLPHIYLPGACYFLTFRLVRAQDLLADRDRDAVVAHIGRMQGSVEAFVVMPDHVHVVYQSQEGEDMPRTLKGLKGASSRTLGKLGARVAPIWQDETFDHIVRDEKELLETCRYVEWNPVRKGLVGVAEEYRWSSAWGRS